MGGVITSMQGGVPGNCPRMASNLRSLTGKRKIILSSVGRVESLLKN